MKDGKESLRKAFNEVLPLPLEEGTASEVSEGFARVPKRMTAARAIALRLVSKAVAGDAKAYEIIRRTLETDEDGGEGVGETLTVELAGGGEP